MTTTWNPADKSGLITLSGGNLTATQTTTPGTWGAVRSTGGLGYINTQKLYAECQFASPNISTVGRWDFGLANASANLSQPMGGADAFGVGFIAFNGNIYYGGGGSSTALFGIVWHPGDWLGLAVDLAAKLLWMKNITQATAWNPLLVGTQDPGTGAGGWPIPATVINGTSEILLAWASEYLGSVPDIGVLNVGATPFAGAIPTGFMAWDSSFTPAVALPFRRQQFLETVEPEPSEELLFTLQRRQLGSGFIPPVTPFIRPYLNVNI